MKWIILLGSMVLITSCCCTTEVIEYRPVAVTPVVEPVSIYNYPQGPLDVTTTTIDYY